jgi:DNA-binding transcriptional ArsR family regulator
MLMSGSASHRHPLDPLYDQFAEVFQALANTKRLHILRCVSEREKSVTEMLACRAFMGVPQSTVSQNLAVLRQQGLIKARKDGTSVFYSLSDPRIVEFLRLAGVLVERRAEEMGEAASGSSE